MISNVIVRTRVQALEVTFIKLQSFSQAPTIWLPDGVLERGMIAIE